MQLSDFRVLTFDTYGTLIDWETGIYSSLGPLLERVERAPPREQVLELFAQTESAQQAETPDMLYSQLLSVVYRTLAEGWNIDVSNDEASRFGASVKDWPAFDDSCPALQHLKPHFKLITLTNCDRESYKGSDARLGQSWDAIYTAQDIGAYKPSHRNFEYLLERVDRDFGFPKEEILHVAQSLFHDHAPANAFGLSTAWIDRRRDVDGYGATMPPSDSYRIDLRFESMAEFVQAHQDELRKQASA
jgi:2-haloalkanoic acid dehalogenase type II